jgi:Na+/alanine symporter
MAHQGGGLGAVSWVEWLTALVTLATALAGLGTAVVNGLRWRRHAAHDDRRFAEVHDRIDGGEGKERT